ncbi:MAG: hypothetical protein VKK80_10600 [Prochlorothrix sp.]|nr:hypothetical protein [Prochlorothrix sp.]
MALFYALMGSCLARFREIQGSGIGAIVRSLSAAPPQNIHPALKI